MASKTGSSAGKKPALTAEEQQKIVSGFQSLRDEQTQLVQKTQDLEMDLKEHDLVLSTLSTITDKQRRCYRMIGGVLIEHTVGEVVPALQANREQINNVIENFKQKTEEKAKELTAYKQKHDIHFSYERPEGQQQSTGKSTNNNTDSGTTTTKKEPQDSGVLVEKDT
jgi:prefoldin subunit 2